MAAESRTALVIVDMVNPLDFPKAGSLLRQALPAARRIAKLRARLKPQGVPVIFVDAGAGGGRGERRDCVDDRDAAPECARGAARDGREGHAVQVDPRVTRIAALRASIRATDS
ncbi:MAG TPA: hypothetical protein VFS99_00850 [Xanthomonadaceae bacterium]|nr:hypothetical protein [Xanthomonadaceae bacterium]